MANTSKDGAESSQDGLTFPNAWADEDGAGWVLRWIGPPHNICGCPNMHRHLDVHASVIVVNAFEGARLATDHVKDCPPESLCSRVAAAAQRGDWSTAARLAEDGLGADF